MSARDRALGAMLLGPFACLADLAYLYFSVPTSKVWLLLGSLVAALLAALGIVLSRRALADESRVGHFVGIMGVVVNAFFLMVVVVGFGMPLLFLHSTD
ncbi:MAG: hypothetical protein JWP97_1596 [Labilithrix sp.]|nr:hypothetical protein [Labilithrix sp.]